MGSLAYIDKNKKFQKNICLHLNTEFHQIRLHNFAGEACRLTDGPTDITFWLLVH